KPKLPPSTRTAPGADQPTPSFFRQETNPFPYFPPKMNAPFLRSGTMTKHCARDSRSCGMDLSGVPITSLNAAAEASNRLGTSDAAERIPAQAASTANNFSFMHVSFEGNQTHDRIRAGINFRARPRL